MSDCIIKWEILSGSYFKKLVICLKKYTVRNVLHKLSKKCNTRVVYDIQSIIHKELSDLSFPALHMLAITKQKKVRLFRKRML